MAISMSTGILVNSVELYRAGLLAPVIQSFRYVKSFDFLKCFHFSSFLWSAGIIEVSVTGSLPGIRCLHIRGLILILVYTTGFVIIALLKPFFSVMRMRLRSGSSAGALDQNVISGSSQPERQGEEQASASSI